ncbi:MAG TPA: poly(A) polymerase [Cyanobacteria bacterium UBA8803]|nr:poly(A) polymerase [Cyanobacteria bacterium UBA9273]HBL57006.1 poly(A) polymerase [Cyanobacteria bacterium UBA8803]
MSQQRVHKKKMATIREVYDRILWDARLDRSAFAIGYIERMSIEGIREKPFSEWATDGDIPMHRIRYIRCREEIVWDRDQHLDLFSAGLLPAAAFLEQPEEETHSATVIPPAQNQDLLFNARPVYQYGSPGWQPTEQPSGKATIGALTIASFNVLCDRYEQERIQTAQRLPAIIEHLRHCDADIIALQEATPPLLEVLLQQDWVRSYAISESPEGQTLKPYGLLLLSRLPFTLVEHQYSAHKRVLVGTWEINGRSLHLAVVHLTSNRAHNALQVRKHQLSLLLEYLKMLPGDGLIVGDFNSRGDEQEEELNQSGFIDVWTLLHPDDTGYTFDPERNPLAALMSLSGEAARFDRLLLRSENGCWMPRAMGLFACAPIPDTQETLYPSDHFGIRAVLDCSTPTTASLQAVPPVYRSAVVVMPSAEVLPAIQAIRRRYDRRFDRWMPHINLLYGFVPEEYFEEAAQAIALALAQFQPFEVTLTSFETFTHRSSCTAWLCPVAQPADALHQLQAILQQLFPQCDEQSQKSGAGFTPHLSVGQFSTVRKAQAQLPSWHPVSLLVESVALISRRGNEPFEVRYRVPLGQGSQGEYSIPTPSSNLMQLLNDIEPELSQEQRQHRETILALVEQACAECLGFPAPLHLVGSARLGVQSPQSDLDVLCLIPEYISGEAFLESVRQCLEGLCDRAQVVTSARIPLLRMRFEGVSVDLLYARRPSELGTLDPLTEAARPFFEPVSWKTLLGCLEADALSAIVRQYVPLESFRQLLRAVRAWAKARQIHGNAWGFLGNFSWALLAAWSCTRYPQAGADKGLEALLTHFFQVLNQQDWSQPVALTQAGRQYQRLPYDWLPVITSIEPCQNSARNVTRSTAQILRRELERGAAISEQVLAGKRGWEALFELADEKAQSDWFLVLTATSENKDSLSACCGWLEGHAIGLVIALEQQLNIYVRPWPGIRRGENASCVVLGLKLSQDCDCVAIEQVGRDFVLQFNGNSDSSILEFVVCDHW